MILRQLKNIMLPSATIVLYCMVWTANMIILSTIDSNSVAHHSANTLILVQCIALPVSLLSILIISRIEDYVMQIGAIFLCHIAHVVYAAYIAIEFYRIIFIDGNPNTPVCGMIWVYSIIAHSYMLYVLLAALYGVFMQLLRCFHENLGGHFNVDVWTLPKSWRRALYRFCGCATFWCAPGSRCHNCCDGLLLMRCNCGAIRETLGSARPEGAV